MVQSNWWLWLQMPYAGFFPITIKHGTNMSRQHVCLFVCLYQLMKILWSYKWGRLLLSLTEPVFKSYEVIFAPQTTLGIYNLLFLPWKESDYCLRERTQVKKSRIGTSNRDHWFHIHLIFCCSGLGSCCRDCTRTSSEVHPTFAKLFH